MGSTPSSESSNYDTVQDAILYSIKQGETNLLTEITINPDILKHCHQDFLSSLLHYAAYHGHEGWVKFLIEQNFDTNGLKDGNETPLHFCVRARRNGLPCAKIILTAKSDINALNAWGRSPLMEAVVQFKFKMADFLLSEGADVNLQDIYRTTPLHVCASYGNLDYVNTLISSGADQNAQDERGRTSLYFAINGNHHDVVNYLINNGCDVNLYDPNFGSPLQKALTQSNVSLVQCLLKVGASTTLYNTSRLTNMRLSLMDLALHTVQVSMEACPTDACEDGTIHGSTAKAVRHIQCFKILLLAHGCALPKNIRDRLKHVIQKNKVYSLNNELTGLQKLANVVSLPLTKGHVDSLQNLCRFQCRKYLMLSNRNVIWACDQLDVSIVLKNILTYKL